MTGLLPRSVRASSRSDPASAGHSRVPGSNRPPPGRVGRPPRSRPYERHGRPRQRSPPPWRGSSPLPPPDLLPGGAGAGAGVERPSGGSRSTLADRSFLYSLSFRIPPDTSRKRTYGGGLPPHVSQSLHFEHQARPGGASRRSSSRPARLRLSPDRHG